MDIYKQILLDLFALVRAAKGYDAEYVYEYAYRALKARKEHLK